MLTLHCHGVTGGIQLSDRQYYPAKSSYEPAFYTRDILVETNQGAIRLVLFASATAALDLAPAEITLKPTLTVVPAVEPMIAAA